MPARPVIARRRAAWLLMPIVGSRSGLMPPEALHEVMQARFIKNKLSFALLKP